MPDPAFEHAFLIDHVSKSAMIRRSTNHVIRDASGLIRVRGRRKKKKEEERYINVCLSQNDCSPNRERGRFIDYACRMEGIFSRNILFVGSTL
jgi:hypothetical protein